MKEIQHFFYLLKYRLKTDLEVQMKTLHVIVKGRVQGVGFRATVEHFATKFGIKGTVKNLSNSSVEIYAQGRPENLEKLVDILRQTRGFAKVDHIAVELCDLQKQFDSFEILF